MKSLQRLLSGNDKLTSDDLTHILFGHAAFQYLNAACEFNIFEILYESPGIGKEELADKLQLEERSITCLMLGLTSLKLVVKEKDTFFNTHLITQMIETEFWKVVKHTTKFEAEIVYLGQADFADSLKQNTNIGLRRIPEEGDGLYNKLNKSPLLFESFYNYMSSWSEMSLPILLNNVDFSSVHSALDIGGGDGTNAIKICEKYPEMKLKILEIPENSIKAKQKVSSAGLDSRISIVEGDFFLDEYPDNTDCILFIHQLVIWTRDKVVFLLKKAIKSLSDHGFVVIFNSFTSDDESGPLMGALDSVYFVSIPSEGGMIYPWKFYEECLKETGFSKIYRSGFLSSWSPHGYIIAYK